LPIVDDNDRALIAALLGLQYEARYGEMNMTPQQQRARLLQTLVGRVIALSRDKPVLFVLEDAHWIDANTLEFLDLCVDQVASRVLIVVTARPTVEHAFGGRPIVTKLALNRLGREPIMAIVNNLSGGKSLPAALLDGIVDKTDGVPLFVEELTKTVLESGELREAEFGYELAGALTHLLVPPAHSRDLVEQGKLAHGLTWGAIP
jgi:predicted ATPase